MKDIWFDYDLSVESKIVGYKEYCYLKTMYRAYMALNNLGLRSSLGHRYKLESENFEKLFPEIVIKAGKGGVRINDE